jgi:hypothetical protein
MEAAVRSHVGQLQAPLVPPPEDAPAIYSYTELRDLLGGNSEIATAAGYGRPGQYRKGTPEWRRRQSFLRNLQRYQKAATGTPGEARIPTRKIGPRLRNISQAQRQRATPRTAGDVIRLMGMQGTTTTLISGWLRYSEDTRNRSIESRVFTSQANYRYVAWPMRGRVPRDSREWETLGRQYVEAWAIAYGAPGLRADPGSGDPVFQFIIGREEPIHYDFGPE